jgi:hypothetical protein
MGMNISQASSILKELPDSQLAQLTQGQHPEIPQYLVMAEINRRQSMRSGAAGQQGADQTTVMQDLMAKQTQPYAPPAVPGYAGGGIVYGDDNPDMYAAQGEPSTYSVPNPMTWTIPLPHIPGLSDIDNYIGNSQKDRQAAAKQQQDKLAARRKASSVPPPPDPYAVDGTYDSKLPDNMPPPPPVAAAAGPAKPAGKPFNIDDYAPPPVHTAPGQGTSTMTKNPFADDDNVDMSADAIAAKYKLPDRVEKPKMLTPDDYLSGINKALPTDEYDKMVASFDDKKKKNDGNKQQALGMALMQAGFGMAASKSPFFMQAAGEGGLRGAASLQHDADEIQKYDHELDKEQRAAIMARQAAQQGNYKLAAELANQGNTTNYHMYDVDRKERGDEIRSIRQTMTEDRKDSRAAKNLQYQYDKLESIERMKVDQMNRADRNAFLRMKAQMAHYDKMYDKPTADQKTTEWLMGNDVKDPQQREAMATSRQKAFSTLQGLKAGPRDEASMRSAYAKNSQNLFFAKRYPNYDAWVSAGYPGYAAEHGVKAPQQSAGGFSILGVE